MRFIKFFLIAFLMCSIVAFAFAQTGFEYAPDNKTLALLHFSEGQGDKIGDESANKVETIVEGAAKWDKNEDWNAAGKSGSSFSFDGNTVIAIPNKVKAVQPEDAITVEAWVFPEYLTGWRLICCHWGGAVVGSYHLGINSGTANFHINTGKGTAFAGDVKQLELKKWQHVAGTYDGKTIRLFINGKEVGSTNHGDKLLSGDPTFEVIIGSKASREFKWMGLMDELRISSIARDVAELSPNLSGPQSVDFSVKSLPAFWGKIKTH
jgi:hypothetical protein